MNTLVGRKAKHTWRRSIATAPNDDTNNFKTSKPIAKFIHSTNRTCKSLFKTVPAFLYFCKRGNEQIIGKRNIFKFHQQITQSIEQPFKITTTSTTTCKIKTRCKLALNVN
ncbi:conserved domain protein [Trichinella spiralis]|uniref:hypothetical protein n=1 Tax=Trichinella spiralis TaxID=6334 RepID=UPI0001EFD391|nr:conserved domain protein [Trichinella spiralis]